MTCALTAFAAAAIEIPKASGPALGMTRGTPCRTGLVFVNGHYLAPPYSVDRWGVGIRINNEPVIGEVVEWTDVLKTQSGVKVTKTVTQPAAPATPAPAAPVVAAPTPPPVADDLGDSLDDLFDDDPKPKKKKAPPKKTFVPRPPKPAKPVTTVSYSLEGDFVPNDASKALVARVQQVRTDIDRTLRAGGFICFGDNYSRVTGDRRATEHLLSKLPEIEKKSENAGDFKAAMRAADFVFLNDALCEDLFRSRYDYRRLMDLRARREKDKEFKKIMNGLNL